MQIYFAISVVNGFGNVRVRVHDIRDLHDHDHVHGRVVGDLFEGFGNVNDSVSNCDDHVLEGLHDIAFELEFFDRSVRFALPGRGQIAKYRLCNILRPLRLHNE